MDAAPSNGGVVPMLWLAKSGVPESNRHLQVHAPAVVLLVSVERHAGEALLRALCRHHFYQPFGKLDVRVQP